MYLGSSPQAKRMEYYFIAITPRPSLVVLVRVLSMGQTDMFANYLFLIVPCAKNFKKQKKKPKKNQQQQQNEHLRDNNTKM